MMQWFYAWRARRTGVNWFTYTGAPPAIESVSEALCRQDKAFLAALEKEMAREMRMSRKEPVIPGDPMAE
jgi:hypothetical protein